MATSDTGAGTSSRPSEPKIWKYDDPYQRPVPKPDGDPWKIILDTLLAEDKIQCDMWKDEVQNLLIFAGLFSAVVTAFTIESYKTFNPTPMRKAFYFLLISFHVWTG